MTSVPSRAPLGAGTEIHDLKWSTAEKAIARKAFNLALERELQAVILEAKSKAAKIQEPSGLWDLEQYLTQRRQALFAQPTLAACACSFYLTENSSLMLS
jgi:hypothetical protein